MSERYDVLCRIAHYSGIALEVIALEYGEYDLAHLQEVLQQYERRDATV